MDGPTPADRTWLAEVRTAESLAELADRLGVASGHEAYLTAKPVWFERRGRELAGDDRDTCASVTTGSPVESIPGSCTPVETVPYHVHGITHADTDAERTFLREQVTQLLEAGAAVFCEQGVRRLYFADTAARVMDDYRWALNRCRDTTAEGYVADLLDDPGVEATDDWTQLTDTDGPASGHDAGSDRDHDAESDRNHGAGSDRNHDAESDRNHDAESDSGHDADESGNRHDTEQSGEPTVEQLRGRFREAALSLLETDVTETADSPLRRALTDVMSAFSPTHEDMAIGRDAESLGHRRRAATDPTKLAVLQRYYERAFLPQPLEREWLARHDAELEIVTHARNARMADYAVAHATSDAQPTPDAVHLIVGAAHGPGVREYLEAHDAGDRQLDGFEPM